MRPRCAHVLVYVNCPITPQKQKRIYDLDDYRPNSKINTKPVRKKNLWRILPVYRIHRGLWIFMTQTRRKSCPDWVFPPKKNPPFCFDSSTHGLFSVMFTIYPHILGFSCLCDTVQKPLYKLKFSALCWLCTDSTLFHWHSHFKAWIIDVT